MTAADLSCSLLHSRLLSGWKKLFPLSVYQMLFTRTAVLRAAKGKDCYRWLQGRAWVLPPRVTRTKPTAWMVVSLPSGLWELETP